MNKENKKKLNEQLIKCVLDDWLSTEVKIRKLEYIIRLGGNVNARYNRIGNSALKLAKILKDKEVVDYLKSKGAREIMPSKLQSKILERLIVGKDGNYKSASEIRDVILSGASLKNEVKRFIKNASVDEINEVLRGIPSGFTLYGDIDLGSKELTELPNFSRFIVDGNFYCQHNQFVTLKGAPKRVTGNFSCNFNSRLVNLYGAPRSVGGNFDCSDCDLGLVNLANAPQKVGGSFYCLRNKLISLTGAPKIVGRDFLCSNNELISLRGAPEVVGRNFNCSGNKISSLKGGPREVGGDFDCSGKKIYSIYDDLVEVKYGLLTSLKGAPETVGGNFSCSMNIITSLKGGPRKVGGDFDCTGCKCTTLEGAPLEVGRDFICGGFIINEEVEELEYGECIYRIIKKRGELRSLKGAPVKVGRDFVCSLNELDSLEGAPSSIEGSFSCSENFLKNLIGAPSKVGGSFLCQNCELISLVGAPSEVGDNFDCCGNNKIEKIMEDGPSIIGKSLICDGHVKSYFLFMQNGKKYNLFRLPCKINMSGDINLSGWGLTKLPDMTDITLRGSLYLANNKLTSLRGCPKEVGGNFDCSANRLVDLRGGPKVVNGTYDCRNNRLNSYKGKAAHIGGMFVGQSCKQIGNNNGGIDR